MSKKANPIFVLTFPIEKEGSKIKRGEMNFTFEAPSNPELIVKDYPTELGYKILIGALADAIASIAEAAGQSTRLSETTLKESAISRLEPVKKAKILGLNGKIIN